MQINMVCNKNKLLTHLISKFDTASLFRQLSVRYYHIFTTLNMPVQISHVFQLGISAHAETKQHG